MKKLILMVLFCVGLSFAQLKSFSSVTLENGASYADDDIDTTATFTLGGVDKVDFRIHVLDSASVVLHTDYRVYGATSWTAVTAASADTIVTTAAGYAHVVLRDHSNERVPGINTQVRFRIAFASSANGTTSATYTAYMEYK